MTLEKARRIEQLRCFRPIHSWRRISEIICEEFDEEEQEYCGMQWHGQELCLAAMCVLENVNTIFELSQEVRDRWDT